MNKRVIRSVVAGKFAWGLPFAYAADTTMNQTKLTLSEMATSVVLSSSTTESAGKLYVNTAAKKSIDFIIKGIQKEATVHVFLAYSKAAGFADQWGEDMPDELELDPDSLQLLAGITLPVTTTISNEETNLGRFNDEDAAVVLPVDLSDLTDIGTEGEAIFFQALAVAIDDSGNWLWETAQVSEVDKFVIDKGSYSDNSTGGGK